MRGVSLFLFAGCLGVFSLLFEADALVKTVFLYNTQTPMALFLSILFLALFTQLFLEIQSIYTGALRMALLVRMKKKRFHSYVAMRLFLCLGLISCLLLFLCLAKKSSDLFVFQGFFGTIVFFGGLSFLLGKIQANYFFLLVCMAFGRLVVTFLVSCI